MSISECLRNTTVSIERPNRYGEGGDEVGPRTVIATDVPAIFEPRFRLFKDPVSGRDVSVSAVFAIDGVDAAGNPLDVRNEDLILFTDPLRGTTRTEEIVNVDPLLDGSKIDHVELEIGG